MDDYYAGNYGDRVADVFDRWYPASPAFNLSCIKILAGLVGDGSALELGPGTGDFADLPVEGNLDLIYSLHSFYYLFTQADQIRFFCNVRRKLTERGVFVVETWLPKRHCHRSGAAILLTSQLVRLECSILAPTLRSK